MKSLYKSLDKYSKSDIYPFHMPGHKRNIKMLNRGNPYLIDITEVEGFDDLHHPSGILKKAIERAAFLYQSEKTYFLVNGSSGGLLTAISACVSKGDKVLLARNCHKSIYHAIFLNELNPIYLYPFFNQEFDLNRAILPEQVERVIKNHLDCKAIIFPSPTYEGVVADVAKIAEIAHQYKIPVIVDEAHGAHFGLDTIFPNSAVQMGADLVVQSLHKTLPSFTQTGLLHVNGNLVDREKVERYFHIYHTTSPSYLFMASIDYCMELIEDHGKELFAQYNKNINEFYIKMKELEKIKLFCGDKESFKQDKSKIVISVKNTSLSGKELFSILLKKYHLEMEMASESYVLAITTICDTKEAFMRLEDALLELDSEIEEQNDQKEIEIYLQPEKVMFLHRAVETVKEKINLAKSCGRISGEYLCLYPPGIPFLVPGERISEAIIRQIKKYKKAGLSIQGIEENDLPIIKVIKED